MRYKKLGANSRGQVIAIFAIVLPILIICMSLAVDFGLAYITRVRLAKAADAAAIVAMQNINLGNTTAIQIATNTFDANYGSTLPTGNLNIAFGTDSNNNTVVNVTATASLNTLLLDFVPGFKTLNVSVTSQVLRPKLIMSLMLDRSGSMNDNGGAQALPGAVVGSCGTSAAGFLCFFDNNNDSVAEISFSSTATVDFPIATNFLNPITSIVNKMNFAGGTFSQSALQNGLNQINSVTVSGSEEVVKVAVFFTDGWANTIQDTLSCPAETLLNYGGCSQVEDEAGWCSGVFFMNPTTGNTTNCGATTFPAQAPPGGNLPLTPCCAPTYTGEINVANDATYRAEAVAETMRSQGITVYSIGLGDKINQNFLYEIANDPNSPTYNPNEPVGQAVFAPTSADLQAVFQTIAAKILIRISQ